MSMRGGQLKELRQGLHLGIKAHVTLLLLLLLLCASGGGGAGRPLAGALRRPQHGGAAQDHK